MASDNGNKKTCAICLCNFRQPKFLPCHHTFCLQCLKDYVKANNFPGSIECPVCRLNVLIPDEGVQCFPANYYCEEAPEDHLTCDACGKQATHWCFECTQNFCDNCASAHMRMKVSREHKMKDFSRIDEDEIVKIKSRVFCSNHPNDEVKLLCKTCNDFICVVCTVTEHREHETADISKEAERTRNQIENQILLSEKHLNESEGIAQRARRQERSLNSSFIEAINEAKTKKHKIVSDINMLFEDFEEKLRLQLFENQEICEDICDEQQRASENFKRTIHNAKENVKEETDVGLLKNYDTLHENLNKVVVVKTPEIDDTGLKSHLEGCETWLDNLEQSNRERNQQMKTKVTCNVGRGSGSYFQGRQGFARNSRSFKTRRPIKKRVVDYEIP